MSYLDVLKNLASGSGKYIWKGLKRVGSQFQHDFKLPEMYDEPYNTGMTLPDGTPVIGHRRRIRPRIFERLSGVVGRELSKHGEDIDYKS